MEKILRINEEEFIHEHEFRDVYEGYVITTDKQAIKFGITNRRDCCENWGYLTTNDNIEDFIGANIIGIETVDTDLNVEKLVYDLELYKEETHTMFININTDKGIFQLVAYNEHNGYYGHAAVFISTQLNVEEYL